MRDERVKRKSDGSSEISAWVSKSRKQEEKRNAEKEKAVRLSKILDEQVGVFKHHSMLWRINYHNTVLRILSSYLHV